MGSGWRTPDEGQEGFLGGAGVDRSPSSPGRSGLSFFNESARSGAGIQGFRGAGVASPVSSDSCQRRVSFIPDVGGGEWAEERGQL